MMRIDRSAQTEWTSPSQGNGAPNGGGTANGGRASQRASNAILDGVPSDHQPAPREQRPLRRIRHRIPSVPPGPEGIVLPNRGTQTMMHDIHNHSIGPGYAATQIVDMTLTLAENAREQIALFDKAGVDKFVWAPIPSVIIQGNAVAAGCCGNDEHPITPGHTSLPANAPSAERQTYYMPEAYRNGAPMTGEAFDQITEIGRQHYNTSVDWQVGKAYQEIRLSDLGKPAHEQIAPRIFPAITGINLGDANAVTSMLRLKKEYPDTFHIIGEITMHKEFVDKQNLDYQPDFSENAPINDILKFAARSGMPVVLHCDSSDAEAAIRSGAAGQGEYFRGIEDLVARHPDTTIVHAHMGGIGKFARPGENHVAKLRELLTRYPNYNIDMSWDVVAENYSPHSAETDPTLKAADEAARSARIQQMAALIQEFPKRFIMGSDALISRNENSISATHELYSGAKRNAEGNFERKTGLFDHLDTALPNVLSENFDALLNDAKVKSSAYENGMMKEDLKALQAAAVNNGRTPNVWPATT